MVGHKWEPFQAVIIQLRPNVSGHGAHREHHYLVRMEGAPGQQHMHWVTEKSEFPRQVGETVAIEVNAKANEVRLDHARNQPPSPTAGGGPGGMAQQFRDGAAAFGQGPGGPGAAGGFPGGVPGAAGVSGGLAALAAAIAAGQAGSPHFAMMAGGQHVQITDEQRQEMVGLAQTMMSGDPAAKQAAMARMHELRDQIRSQAGQPGQPGQPGQSTGQQGGFGQQGGLGQPGFGQPGFGQPGFEQPGSGQQGGFGAPQFPGGAPQPAPTPQPSSSFGSFDTSGGQGTQEQRIAKLQDLLNKGILTQSEFEAQRQQILGGG